ncbi:MAG: hypothetical protein ACOVOR_02970 [Rhabdochlamydiaceae bacterium]
MSSITINNLPLKFRPFLLGSPSCSANIKPEIDAIFQKDLKPLEKAFSSYIFDGGNYILKNSRQDGSLTPPDTHLYRIRKAEKIRAYIQKNNLEDHLVVPKKYLYWHTQEEKFYVVAEKMHLSKEVASLASPDLELQYRKCGKSFGQCASLSSGATQRDLTPIQAKTLAELSILGYTDLSYNNLYFTLDGKIAIIDTKPQKRALNKILCSGAISLLFFDKTVLLSQQSIAGIAKLKTYVKNPIAMKKVNRVERNHVLWTMTQLVMKISLLNIVLYFNHRITTRIPLTVLRTTLETTITVTTILKICFNLLNILKIHLLWSLSCKENGEGLDLIRQREKLCFF